MCKLKGMQKVYAERIDKTDKSTLSEVSFSVTSNKRVGYGIRQQYVFLFLDHFYILQ